jgi:hypothetical protein
MAPHKSSQAIDYSMIFTRKVVGKQLLRRVDTGSTLGAVIGVLVCLVIIGFLCKIGSRSSTDPLGNEEVIRRRQRERDYEVALQTLSERSRRNGDSVDLWNGHVGQKLQTPPAVHSEGPAS